MASSTSELSRKAPAKTSQHDILSLTSSLQKTSLEQVEPYTLVDTADGIAKLVDNLEDLPTAPPSLYVDLEGVELSRHGTISVLQIFVLPQNMVYLVDIYTLKETAFSTAGASGQTLKRILESEAIPKAFFDVRNDSDALYSHFGIDLAGIQDIQLMELATRTFSRTYVKGLSRCIERDAPLTMREKQIWQAAKAKGLRLFTPERGGSYEVFNTRPLPEGIIQYCTQDVQFLSKLWLAYDRKLTTRWAERVREATKDRVKLSQSKSYNAQGRHKAMAPPGWA